MIDAREHNGLGRRQSQLASRLIACACACAQAYFPDGESTTTLTAAQYLLTGKYDYWASFDSLPLDDQRRLSRLLAHRANPLANDTAFRDHAIADFFEKRVPGFRLYDDRERVVGHHGLDPRACADQLLAEMDDIRASQSVLSTVAKPGEYTHTLRVPMAGGQHAPVLAYYTFDEHHAPNPRAHPPRLRTAAELSEVPLKVPDFLQLNDELDQETKNAFRAETLTPFFQQMRTAQGERVEDMLSLRAGPTGVLSAPTGSGKSVLLRSYATWAVQEGHTVALVVDTNANALKLTHAIEQDLKAWGVRDRLGEDASTVVVPLMSPHSLMREVERAVKGSHDRDYVDWVFARIGYSCQLPACASVEEAVDTWVPGGEPCTKLTPVRPERGEPYRSMPIPKVCPFRQGCGKFRLARQATTARVIVTTHANLYEGRMHIPLELDDGTVDEKVSVEKFLMSRAQVLLIDELDAFQSTVTDRSGRGLPLAWGDRGHNCPLLGVDAQLLSAFTRLPAALEERTRSNVSDCRILAETYIMHLARGDLTLSEELLDDPLQKPRKKRGGRRWIVPQRWDGWLAGHLAAFLADDRDSASSAPEAREASEAAVLLEAVCDRRVATYVLPSHVREFAHLVRSVTERANAAGVLEHARGELYEMLAPWIPAGKVRSAVIDRLARRMFLVPLREMLYGFVHDAPQLKLAGVPAAEEIARALGGYEVWRAIPHGPLGRLVFAFTEDHNPKSPLETKLSAAAFGGDPHRYITSLGQVTALAHTGHPRVVLGLSATAYMPGAHRHHIHIRPQFVVPDEGSSVAIDARPIPDLEGELIRISGLSGRKRREATKQLGMKLWSELSRELETLAEEGLSGIQDAILLATTSYDSCRDLAEGMRIAGASPGLIAVAVRPDSDSANAAAPDDRPWTEIPGDQLEDFGARADARVLIAPLKRAERSLNILTPGERRSRIGSIWLAVRPMSIVDDPDELLAHVGTSALDQRRVHDKPWLELARTRKAAGKYLDELLSSQRYFSALPRRAKKAIAAELIASIIQLVGRARRGGTPGRIRLVDYAFLDPKGNSDLPSLIRQLRADWARTGDLDTLLATNGQALRAFFRFADDHHASANSMDTAC